MANSTLTSLISTLGAPLASTLLGNSQAMQQVENDLTAIETNLNDPISVARLAQQATGIAGIGTQTLLLLDKIVSLAQATTYNPALVMAEVSAIQALFAQSRGNIFSHIGASSTP